MFRWVFSSFFRTVHGKRPDAEAIASKQSETLARPNDFQVGPPTHMGPASIAGDSVRQQLRSDPEGIEALLKDFMNLSGFDREYLLDEICESDDVRDDAAVRIAGALTDLFVLRLLQREQDLRYKIHCALVAMNVNSVQPLWKAMRRADQFCREEVAETAMCAFRCALVKRFAPPNVAKSSMRQIRPRHQAALLDHRGNALTSEAEHSQSEVDLANAWLDRIGDLTLEFVLSAVRSNNQRFSKFVESFKSETKKTYEALSTAAPAWAAICDEYVRAHCDTAKAFLAGREQVAFSDRMTQLLRDWSVEFGQLPETDVAQKEVSQMWQWLGHCGSWVAPLTCLNGLLSVPKAATAVLEGYPANFAYADRARLSSLACLASECRLHAVQQSESLVARALSVLRDAPKRSLWEVLPMMLPQHYSEMNASMNANRASESRQQESHTSTLGLREIWGIVGHAVAARGDLSQSFSSHEEANAADFQVETVLSNNIDSTDEAILVVASYRERDFPKVMIECAEKFGRRATTCGIFSIGRLATFGEKGIHALCSLIHKSGSYYDDGVTQAIAATIFTMLVGEQFPLQERGTLLLVASFVGPDDKARYPRGSSSWSPVRWENMTRALDQESREALKRALATATLSQQTSQWAFQSLCNFTWRNLHSPIEKDFDSFLELETGTVARHLTSVLESDADANIKAGVVARLLQSRTTVFGSIVSDWVSRSEVSLTVPTLSAVVGTAIGEAGQTFVNNCLADSRNQIAAGAVLICLKGKGNHAPILEVVRSRLELLVEAPMVLDELKQHPDLLVSFGAHCLGTLRETTIRCLAEIARLILEGEYVAAGKLLGFRPLNSSQSVTDDNSAVKLLPSAEKCDLLQLAGETLALIHRLLVRVASEIDRKQGNASSGLIEQLQSFISSPEFAQKKSSLMRQILTPIYSDLPTMLKLAARCEAELPAASAVVEPRHIWRAESNRLGAQSSYDLLVNACGWVNSSAGHGTAFAVSPDAMLTCRHVITDSLTGRVTPASSVRVKLWSEHWREVERIELPFGDWADLAILYLAREASPTRQPLSPLTISASPYLAPGSQIVAGGFPLATSDEHGATFIGNFKVATGHIRGWQNPSTDTDVVVQIEFDANITHGVSGGPLLTEAGEVIGVCTSGRQRGHAGISSFRISLATPAFLAIPFLRWSELQETERHS